MMRSPRSTPNISPLRQKSPWRWLILISRRSWIYFMWLLYSPSTVLSCAGVNDSNFIRRLMESVKRLSLYLVARGYYGQSSIMVWLINGDRLTGFRDKIINCVLLLLNDFYNVCCFYNGYLADRN